MNRKKLVALIMVLALAFTTLVGGTLAYFTDDGDAVNTFTYGNIDIELIEKGVNAAGEEVDFEELTEAEKELMPTTGKDANGNVKNAVAKKVSVESVGDNPAYVRLHIAIPQILDNGSTEFDASKNLLHFNATEDVLGKDGWNWGKALATETGKFVSEGDDWNFYTAEIEGIWYNVYVATYETVLEKEDVTPLAMHQVYMEQTATQEDMAKVAQELGTTWNMVIVAEGVQSEGFDDAFTALNAAFGVPGEYSVEWPQVAPQE